MSMTTVRLIAVLELLQSRDRVTGADISEQLEIDRRSVRRYIKQLQDMGIPITGERGRYGAYRLERGYKLPPLMFNEEEIVALTLGLMMIRAYRIPIEPSSVAGAFAKIERTVPKQFLNQLRALQKAVRFSSVMPPSDVREDIIEKMAMAAVGLNRIHLDYRMQTGDEIQCDYDTYGIVFHEGYWYACGYCYAKQDLDILRIDRITNVAVLDDTFTRPTDLNTLEFVTNALK